MAAATLIADGFVVGTIGFVASDTGRRSVPVFVIRLVTTLALESVVVTE
jgi:hypothetical protein